MPAKYDDCDWDDLPADAKAAATTLGYTKKMWDKDKEPDLCKNSDWDDLTAEQKKAAEALGYGKKVWDS